MKRTYGILSLLMFVAVFTAMTPLASACMLTNLTLTAASGPPGTVVTAYSTGGLPSAPYSLLWDGSTPLVSGTTDSSGIGSVQFTVPAIATVGDHTVVYTDEGGVKCSAVFTITASAGVQADAYVSPVTTLPSTGLLFALPAASLAAFGAGAWFLRRRK